MNQPVWPPPQPAADPQRTAREEAYFRYHPRPTGARALSLGRAVGQLRAGAGALL